MPNRMRTPSVRKILDIKILASTTLPQITKILDIQSEWDTDDEELETKSLKVKIKCENASAMLDTTIELCGQMVNNPPSYNANHPDERYHQVLQLDILLMRAFCDLDLIHDVIGEMKEISDGCPDLECKEAEERAFDAKNKIEDAHDMITFFVDWSSERDEVATQ